MPTLSYIRIFRLNTMWMLPNLLTKNQFHWLKWPNWTTTKLFMNNNSHIVYIIKIADGNSFAPLISPQKDVSNRNTNDDINGIRKYVYNCDYRQQLLKICTYLASV